MTSDPGTGLLYAQANGGTGYFRYDPRTNAWTDLLPAPINSGNNGGAAYLGGKIYIVYTSNSSELAVYDIASGSWGTIANPLGLGTANITAGDGKLFLANGQKFVSYDPATDVTTPLAEPPKFEPADCGDGFESWGGLQFTGAKIYGHQGNGCTGFGVYDIPSNSWQELPLAPEVPSSPGEEPEGPVAGSALDPVTNTYLTYGPYGGTTLFRYDIEAGSWTTGALPFEVGDGALAYLSLAGFEGTYVIQGEEGPGFIRYNERNQTDLSPSMTATAVGSKKAGTLTYSIQVKNNGPERASGVVLSNPLPAGATLVSVATSQGTCGGTASISCSLGILRSGASASLTIKMSAKLGKKVTNTATVSSQAVDTNPGNDSATVAATVPACVVPKLKGRSLKGAKKALRRAGCKPGKVSRRYNAKFDKKKVVRGNKGRGKVLPPGSKVKLTVSRGDKPEGHGKSKGAKAKGAN
ncbi:MAG TPA: PASTA domain-containing protein [Solirubrobacterales bacterium]|nr:PASTA domain-containing protein [Solirubrobacterales bacterium]